MRTHRIVFVSLAWMGTWTHVALGQTPAPAPRAAPAQTKSGVTTPAPRVYANLAQLMRGILFENSALAMSEAANLLMMPGRKCSNGVAVPIRNADWPKFVQGLRDAGVTAYKAAQTKNTDNILMAADAITEACANCHNKYREKPTLADRCK